MLKRLVGILFLHNGQKSFKIKVIFLVSFRIKIIRWKMHRKSDLIKTESFSLDMRLTLFRTCLKVSNQNWESMFVLVVFVQIFLSLFVKKSRQIQIRQILGRFSVFKRYEKFVKSMSSNFSSRKVAKISRQMNRSQKLKRKKTCKRPYPTASLPSWSYRGRGKV